MKTTNQIAFEKGLNVRTLRRACVRLGIVKAGRDYLLTPSQEARVVAACYDKPGRPRLSKSQ